MAKTTSSFTLGQTPERFSSGGMTLDEAAREADRISGRVPEPVVEEEEKDPRSPAQRYMDNQRLREQQVEQENLNEVPAANDTLSLSGADKIQIKMDVGEQILATLPGKGMWDVKNNRATFFTSDGREFDGTDVANSAGAVENFVAETLGEDFRAIYSRSVTAPLDPAYRLQENAKGTANPILSEMQKQGLIAEDYSAGDIGIVEDANIVGITSEMRKAAPAMLSKGISPTDLMIQFGAKLADTKEFKELPDAAKVAVVRELADQVDQVDSVIVSKTLMAIAGHFNQVEQSAEKEIAKTAADMATDDSAPVDSFERAGLLKQAQAGVQGIRDLSKTLFAQSPREVLDTPWAVRQARHEEGVAQLGEMKQRVSQQVSRALRDQPQAVVDEATSALFDINRDLVAEGLSLDKMVSSLETSGIDLSKVSEGDRRKFLLGRAIDKWFVSKSKDPAKAPVYASLRQKMRETIAKGGKLDPSIEASVKALSDQIVFMVSRKSEEVALTSQIASANTVEELQKTVDSYKVGGKLPSQIQTLVNTRAAAIGEKQRHLANGLKTLETTLDSDNPMYVAHDESGKPIGAVSLNATEDADGNPVEPGYFYAKARLDSITHYSQFGKEAVNEMLGKLDAAKARADSTEAVKSKLSWWALTPIGAAIKTGSALREIQDVKGQIRDKKESLSTTPTVTVVRTGRKKDGTIVEELSDGTVRER